MKTIVIHRVTSSKFGNRMKYTKEKTGPYHTGFSHFLCHCITDFFLSVDIQIVSLVIHARFLYHYPITGNSSFSHPCKSRDYFMQKRV